MLTDRLAVSRLLTCLFILFFITFTQTSHAQYNGKKIIDCLIDSCGNDIVLIAAHRGVIDSVQGQVPENSELSIQRAIDNGIEMVELDVFSSAPASGKTSIFATAQYLIHDNNTFRTVYGGSLAQPTNYYPNQTNKNLISYEEVENMPPGLCGGRGRLIPNTDNPGVKNECPFGSGEFLPVLDDILSAVTGKWAKWGGVIILDIRDPVTFATSYCRYSRFFPTSQTLPQHIIFKIYPEQFSNAFSAPGLDYYGWAGVNKAIELVKTSCGVAPQPFNLMLAFRTATAIQATKRSGMTEWAIDAQKEFEYYPPPGVTLVSPLATVKALANTGGTFETGSGDPLFSELQAGNLAYANRNFNVPGIYSPTLECRGADNNLPGDNGQWSNNGNCYAAPAPSRDESSDETDHRSDWNNLEQLGARFIITDDAVGLARFLAQKGKRDLSNIK